MTVPPTVYSLYYPETRAAVEGLWKARPHLLYEDAWERTDERMDQAFLSAWARWSGLDLSAFPHRYVTAGASEAIRELVCSRREPVHVFDGEYEGFGRYAEAYGLPVFVHRRDAEPAQRLEHGSFWVSEPSGIDGESFLSLRWRLPWQRLVLDLSYWGTCKELPALDLSAFPGLHAVVFSLSKPFGVYRHRIGGVFSKTPLPGLEGNRWFNNAFSLCLGLRLMESFGPTDLPRRYAGFQREALSKAQANGLVPADAVPSNCVLLATSKTGPAEYARGGPDGVRRYCLSPILRDLIGDRRPRGG